VSWRAEGAPSARGAAQGAAQGAAGAAETPGSLHPASEAAAHEAAIFGEVAAQGTTKDTTRKRRFLFFKRS
jgi:hypothetical protein